ncbi:DDE-type integrase/transposase/recombinase [Cryobacterium roopkundense]|uniref:Transposase InsO family protein n=1 Tax=Cryobacterium roopkundense TaxID=1001240 RepID=A0A7W8ZZS3_9MICO|nr:DDE-type integrase/transposase/recombinase [Cryobacterium roopkundense]MBB5643152.1 transposase InsO family protein [Cryobacterium roopkundense]
MPSIDINSELHFHDGAYLVAGFHGSLLKLRHCVTGEYSTVHIADISARLIEPPLRKHSDPRSLDSRTKAESKALDVYAAHITEMVTGENPTAPDQAPRPEYDPDTTTLNQRIEAKVEELKRMGLPASRATLIRKRRALEQGGTAGLIDGRSLRAESPLDRADSRIIDTLTHVIGDETYDSTGTGLRLQERMKAELLSTYPGQAIKVPSESTLYRYIGYLTKGKYTTGSAQTRRTAANTPKRPFGTARRMRPGQEVQIDSSPWDILVRDANGTATRAVLTIMMDVATRSIIASSVRSTAAKGLDHAFLLAQCLVPRPLRPGNEDLWKLAQRRMPWADLTSEEERSRLDLTRPFICPDRIMMDNGRDYRSTVFEAACRKFDVTLTYSAPHTPTDKAIVERTFHSIKTLFAQDLPGFKGGSVAERGDRIENGALLDVVTLAEYFDEWVTRVWQNQPHDNLRDPLYPTVKLTPNEMYNASFDIAGQLPLPLTSDDYIELMPVEWRTIQPAGVKISGRFYDSIDLQPFRNSPSNNPRHNNLWEARTNPYDPRAIWVRHPDGHWMECLWRDESTYRQPFADEIFQNAVDIASTRTGADTELLKQAKTDIRKRAAASALTFKKAAARDAKALQLAELEHTPFPTATAPAPAPAPAESARPSTQPFASDEDDEDFDDGTAEIDFETLSEMGNN